MKRKLPLLFTAALVTVMVFTVAMTAGANMGGFSMTPIFPENQNPETRGFFDLQVEAGMRQEINVEVSNFGEEPIDVSLSLITASTNRNGIINYTSPGIDDETLVHPFVEISQFADGVEIVTVPPDESVIVPIFIDIPAEGFDGIILGSVHALLEITDEQRAEAGMIVNRFAHVVVVRLQERDTEIAANFELGDVRADLVNHRASIIAEIRNTQPRLSMGAIVHAQIYPVDSDEPIFALSNVSVDFAPNTVFPFSLVDEAGYGLHPGDYLARIQIEHGGEDWDFEHHFEILPEQAQEINAAAVNIQQQHPPAEPSPLESGDAFLAFLEENLLLIGGIVLLVLALLVVILAVMLARNNKRAKKAQSPTITDEELQKRLESLGVKTATVEESTDNTITTDKAKATESTKAIEIATTTDSTESDSPSTSESEPQPPKTQATPQKDNQSKKENVKISVRKKKGK